MIVTAIILEVGDIIKRWGCKYKIVHTDEERVYYVSYNKGHQSGCLNDSLNRDSYIGRRSKEKIELITNL